MSTTARSPQAPGELPVLAGESGGALGVALAGHSPIIIPSSPLLWRASVSLILRWTSEQLPPSSAPLQMLLCTHAHALELLFIHRSARDGDPWSGHVGFPGGRREDDDESDLACAVRETWEELGIDLRDVKQHMYLGRLDDDVVPVRQRGKRTGVLSAFVFLQTMPLEKAGGSRAMVLDASEVAACMWLPVSCLLSGSHARVHHVYPLASKDLGPLRRLPRPLIRVLGMHRMKYTAVDVFGSCTEIIYADGPDGNACLETLDRHMLPVLWGLSFRAASDLVTICGGQSHVATQPAFVFDNRILALLHRGAHRVFVFFSRRLGALGISLPRRRIEWL